LTCHTPAQTRGDCCAHHNFSRATGAANLFLNQARHRRALVGFKPPYGRNPDEPPFNLDFYCKAFGVESPKSKGVTGRDIGSLLVEGRYRDIAEYCLRDVQATVQLYHIWKERLSGIK